MSETLKRRLIDFARGAAPVSLQRASFKYYRFIPDALQGKNTGALLMLGYRAQDVLIGGDPLLKTLRFNQDDNMALDSGYRVLRDLALYGDWPAGLRIETADDAMQILRPLQHAILRIGTYFADKNVALDRHIATRTTEGRVILAEFNRRAMARDYDYILKECPQALVNLGVLAHPLPQGSGGTESDFITRMRAYAALKTFLDNNPDKPDVVIRRLGTPRALMPYSNDLNTMGAEKSANAAIAEGIESLLLAMDQALTPPVRYTRVFYRQP